MDSPKYVSQVVSTCSDRERSRLELSVHNSCRDKDNALQGFDKHSASCTGISHEIRLRYHSLLSRVFDAGSQWMLSLRKLRKSIFVLMPASLVCVFKTITSPFANHSATLEFAEQLVGCSLQR